LVAPSPDRHFDLDWAYRGIEAARTLRYRGRIDTASGGVLTCAGMPARVGDVARVEGAGSGGALLEAVGFREGRVVFMPLEDPGPVGPESEVVLLGRGLSVRGGRELMGRVLDGLGRPLDGGPPPASGGDVARPGSSPHPLTRRPIREPLGTGVSSLDGLLSFGRGQRLGIFAGGGVGKSTLLGKIARESTASVNVIALIGERGLEVRSFIEDSLGEEGLARSVVVVATSDMPAQQRYRATFLAVSLAESFREEGDDVLFIMDSVTRFATAVREIGLARGEPPTMRGYPPSLFGSLPRLVERLGNSSVGTASSLMTILVEGDDMTDPVADTMRAVLDGHVILSRDLGARQHYPAVDVLASVSRAMSAIVDPDHARAARRFRELYATYRENEDLITIGAYRAGASVELDLAVKLLPRMNAFLRQGTEERRTFAETRRELLAIMEEAG